MKDEETENCLGCAGEFSRWKRKHHCRNCGVVKCDECTAWEHAVPGCGEDRVRVCALCLAALEQLSTSRPTP